MKQTFKRTCLIFVLATVTGAMSRGQSTAPQVNVSIRLISWDRVITDLMYVNSAAQKMVPVSILPNTRSGFYKYAGPDPVTFFRVKLGPDGKPLLDDKGNPQYEMAGVASVQGFRRPLLMFFRNQKVPSQYSIIAMEDDDSAVPGGYCRFVNFSSNELKIKCGASDGSVPPSQAVTLSAAPAGGDPAASIVITANDGQQAARVYSNRWLYNKSLRVLAFIFYSPECKMYVVKRIVEDVAAAQEPKPSPAH